MEKKNVKKNPGLAFFIPFNKIIRKNYGDNVGSGASFVPDDTRQLMEV
jgi:hypothetical protein